MNSRDRDLRAKKEGDDPNYNIKLPKITSSRQWSSHKNPRIVRVSRTFGGKDRHSKVCTVKGLRDRRIRLSVPTAIQLYDLQDRLGLSQPSKVIDWLLDAAKHDVDKLPPLPVIPGSTFTQFQQPTQLHGSPFLPTKQGQEQENQEGFGAQNLFPLSNQSNSFPNLPHFHWDPPSLSLSHSHIGGGFPLSNQTEDHSHNINLLNSNSHLYLCPSATTIPSTIPSFPPYIAPSMDNNDNWRQMNSLQNPLLPTTLHLISSPMKSFTLNVNSKSVHERNKN